MSFAPEFVKIVGESEFEYFKLISIIPNIDIEYRKIMRHFTKFIFKCKNK